MLLLGLMWYVPYVGLANLHKKLPLILGIVFGGIVALVFASLTILALTVLLGRDLPFSRNLRGVLIKVLLPLMSGVGKLFGVSKDQVRRSFIEINNQLLLAAHPRATPDKLLLLMPHCLQFHECEFRITGNVVHCQRCGQCAISGLAGLSEKYGVGLAVATGGTLARRIIVERRPKIIIAVANTKMYAGNRVVLLPRFDPKATLDAMVAESVNFWVGVPTMYWALLKYVDETGYDISRIADNMKVCTSGGAPMPVEVMHRVSGEIRRSRDGGLRPVGNVAARDI